MTTKTKGIKFNEEESLVLWRALEVYIDAMYSCNNHKAKMNDYETANLLWAKVMHRAYSFADTLDGRTVKEIYQELVSD